MNESPSLRQLIGLGASIVGSVVLGLVAGLILDAIMGTSPIFVVIGIAVGIACAAGTMVVQFRTFMRD